MRKRKQRLEYEKVVGSYGQLSVEEDNPSHVAIVLAAFRQISFTN
jgi:hypothetical protein